MQSSLLVSVDMMPAAPPASAPAAKTGQDDLFAAHLAAASSQGQATTAPQATTANKQENTSSRDEQILDTENETPAQPKEARNTKETATDNAGKTTAPGYNIAAQLKEILSSRETGNDTTGKTTAPGYDIAAQLKEILLNAKETDNGNTGKNTASDDKTTKGQSLDDPTSEALLNGSAGAANAGIILLHWTGADIGFTPNTQAIAKTQNNGSIIARMLDAITSAADGTMGAPQTNTPTAPAQTEATATVQTDPAVQSFISEAKQPQVPTNQPIASPDSAGAITVPNASSSGKNGLAQNDSTNHQPQITVSFVSDAAPAAETAAQQSPAQQGGDQVVQNKYGQIITIYQSSESQEMAAATPADSKLLPPVTNSKNIDASNNFIQSHLADDVASKTLEKESSSQQQDTAKDNQQKGANTAPKNITNVQLQPEQVTPQAFQLTVGPENQSLLAPQQQVGTPLISTPLADSSLLRLPSGLTVPGETVVDQMISHFSVKNHLESGTVNLKLHPQELGELRMEIKITQDTIKAHIIAQTPQAQEMISQHLPRLREALEQQGLHLQQIEVTIAANDSFSRDQFQGNSGQQQLNQSTHNSRGNQPIFTLDTGEEAGEATQIINNLSVMA